MSIWWPLHYITLHYPDALFQVKSLQFISISGIRRFQLPVSDLLPVRDFCQLWLCQFHYVSVRAPHGTLAGHAQGPYGSHRIWKTLKIPVRGPHDARTGIARGTRGVLRIFQPNHKYADVSSHTGPVAWCDQGNSTDVKFLWALHSALRARNRMGDKIRTGPVVGCDWGITGVNWANSLYLAQLWNRFPSISRH